DDPEVARKVSELIAVAMPRSKHAVEQYTGRDGLLHDAGLEEAIEKIYARKVELPGGGYLVVDQTEALVAIDVNSGRYREHSDAETTASKINLAAAREIGRQLRLRDLGGMILIDFIDMRESRNCRAVEKTLRTALVNDRAKSKILKMSAFGIVEMTRQRLGPSLRHSVYCICSHCDGMGLIKSPESQALQALRMLRRAIANEDVIRVEVTVTIPVEHELANRHRAALAALEAVAGKRILLTASADAKGEEIRISCLNTRGTEVAWEMTDHAPSRTPLTTVGFEEVSVIEDETPDDEPPMGTPEISQPAEEPADDDVAPEAHSTEEAPSREGGRRRRRGRRRGGEDRQRTGQQGQQGQPHAPAPGGRDKDQPHAHPDRQGQRPPQGRQESQQRGPQNQQQQRPKQQQQPKPQPQPPKPQPQGQPAQPAPEGSPGVPGENGKSRRRGRRGGRKHRRNRNGAPGLPNGTPAQATPSPASGGESAPATPAQPQPAPAPVRESQPASPPVQPPRVEPAPAPQPAQTEEPAPAWNLTPGPAKAEKPTAVEAPAAETAVPAPAKKARKPRAVAAKRKRAPKKKTSLPDPNAIPEDTLSDDPFSDDV
ncbi:MAG: ribonuclease E/G, partial [Planctomycetota bacterium]|nr:ribonuclease E/G [Planctomycetota bacterium]